MSKARIRVAVGVDAATEAAAASTAGADLLILQRPPEAPPEPSDGSRAHAMGELARFHRLAVLYAYAELCSGRSYAALQLVMADGRATANYRAAHLGASSVTSGWSVGNWLTMARVEPLTLGLLAGLDHAAPETARALSALGAQALIAVIDEAHAAAGHLPGDLLGPLARLRAIENGVPVCLVAPDGTVHASAADGTELPAARRDSLHLLTLEAEAPAQAAPRRPDLYGQLVRDLSR